MTKQYCVMTRLGGVKAGWLSEATQNKYCKQYLMELTTDVQDFLNLHKGVKE